MKVLVTSRSFGKINDIPEKILKDAGFEIDYIGKNTESDDFNEIISNYDALIIGAHLFDEKIMEKCHKLKIICKHGVGFDNIPCNKAKELGITVCNTPGTNSNAVADFSIGLMLNLCRRITYASDQVKKGTWTFEIGEDLYNKTLGLIGFGAIAQNVAKRARGFDMRVITYDPFIKNIPDEYSQYVELESFDYIIQNSDFISLHVPLNEETKNSIAATELRKMKKGAYIINAARGGIVNELELYESIRIGHIAGAAIDCPISEPVEKDHPLLALNNVIITPHIGMASAEALNAVSIICAENIVSKFNDKEVKFEIK